jgi:hypothetical protein
MTRELLFWIVMLIWLLAAVGGIRGHNLKLLAVDAAGWLLPWIAVAVLGWCALGPAIK